MSDDVQERQTIDGVLNDPSLRDDYYDQEHLTQRDKSQELVTSITGTTEAVPKRDTEVRDIARSRAEVDRAERGLRDSLMRKPGQAEPVVEQSVEVVFRSVYCQAGVSTKLVNYNYNRTRLLISGLGTSDIYISEQPINNAVSGTPPFNSAQVAYQTAADPWEREIKTLRDIYAVSMVGGFISVQEEFFSAA